MKRSLLLLVSLSICLVLSACGTDDVNGGSSDGGRLVPDADQSDVDPTQDAGCEPQTCEALGAECGAVDNGCGTMISCGSCPDGEACGSGVDANRCLCAGEPASELCAEEGAACGEVTVTDRCGVERTVDCGGCADGAACTEQNTCGCPGQSDEELCQENPGVECGEITVTDDCGVERTVDCGGCGAREACNEANQCECAPYQCGGPFTSCGLNDDGCGGEILCTDGCNEVLALGGHHTCVAEARGGMRCWGKNKHGQIGDGTNEHRYVPTSLPDITDKVYSIGLGEKHSCANVAGEIHCWGDNDRTQAGQADDNATYNTPQLVTGFQGNVSSLGSGNYHGCSTLELSGLYCWGANGFGQLGNGNATWKEPDPLQAVFPDPQPSFIAKVDGGPLFTCALDDAGVLYCWGENTFGQVAPRDAFGDPPAPMVRPGINQKVVDFSAGGWYGDGSGSGVRCANGDYSSITGFTCAVLEDGSVKCWGANIVGQLGNGSTDNYSEVPAQVVGITSGAVKVTAGGDHACALMDDGSVKCWGSNVYGQLGDGTTDCTIEPVDVVGLNGKAVTIVAGAFHTCAALESGELQCWGRNNRGQLGIGIPDHQSTPVTVFP